MALSRRRFLRAATTAAAGIAAAPRLAYGRAGLTNDIFTNVLRDASVLQYLRAVPEDRERNHLLVGGHSQQSAPR